MMFLSIKEIHYKKKQNNSLSSSASFISSFRWSFNEIGSSLSSQSSNLSWCIQDSDFLSFISGGLPVMSLWDKEDLYKVIEALLISLCIPLHTGFLLYLSSLMEYFADLIEWNNLTNQWQLSAFLWSICPVLHYL